MREIAGLIHDTDTRLDGHVLLLDEHHDGWQIKGWALEDDDTVCRAFYERFQKDPMKYTAFNKMWSRSDYTAPEPYVISADNVTIKEVLSDTMAAYRDKLPNDDKPIAPVPLVSQLGSDTRWPAGKCEICHRDVYLLGNPNPANFHIICSECFSGRNNDD